MNLLKIYINKKALCVMYEMKLISFLKVCEMGSYEVVTLGKPQAGVLCAFHCGYVNLPLFV